MKSDSRLHAHASGFSLSRAKKRASPIKQFLIIFHALIVSIYIIEQCIRQEWRLLFQIETEKNNKKRTKRNAIGAAEKRRESKHQWLREGRRRKREREQRNTPAKLSNSSLVQRRQASLTLRRGAMEAQFLHFCKVSLSLCMSSGLCRLNSHTLFLNSGSIAIDLYASEVLSDLVLGTFFFF